MASPLDETRIEEAVRIGTEWFKANAKGYWITRTGQLHVDFQKPSLWRRFVNACYGESCVPYK